MKRNIKISTCPFALVLILFFYISMTSCSNSVQELTAQIAMDSLVKKTPVEGANFYMKMRSDYKFMDKLYADSIVPILHTCNYFELKEICLIIKDTPNAKNVYALYLTAKEQIAKSIYSEIEKKCQLEIKTFEELILPAIRLEMDSTLEDNVKSVFSKYAGGFLNYRKMYFLLGRNQKDFKKLFWDKLDTTLYKNHINQHIQAYLDTLFIKQNLFSNDIINKKIAQKQIMTQPTLRIGLSKSTMKHIKKYTTGQVDEIIQEAFKDYVAPLAIGAAIGGAGVVYKLYDVGNDIYDVAITIKDIKEAKVDADDMVIYVCTHDLSYQIDNFYLKDCSKIAKKTNSQL
ncbi:hypothetical protein [Prevotella intermedia]|jgi:lipoprotein|uniref:hypothetical protein n=1 Tax=Prevotella intermedia TaxID=28131 RepID=UPI0011857F0D|nr:hypothetical protein [Prevotella intermedia]